MRGLMEGRDRWTLPDRASALDRCAHRNAQGIRCTLDILGRHAKSGDEANGELRTHLDLVRNIGENTSRASVAVKPSTLGAAFDRELCRQNILVLAGAGRERGIQIELDMEGRSLVDFTLRTALEAASTGLPVTLTLQAYLDRTPSDLERALERDMRVRLVKGAYVGDAGDFVAIQERMRSLTTRLIAAGALFCVGTHDPELIGWLEKVADGKRLQFGFLMGLADHTKLRLAGEGWQVSEYVPFGTDSSAYISRRMRYLDGLRRLGRTPSD